MSWACLMSRIGNYQASSAFLAWAGPNVEAGLDAILFNRGFFIQKLAASGLLTWSPPGKGRTPVVLETPDYTGGGGRRSYYCYVRSTGLGLLVRGGLPRTYYVGIEVSTRPRSGACRVPGLLEALRMGLYWTGPRRPPIAANRRSPSGSTVHSSVSETIAGRSSISREELDSDLHLHAPLHAVIRFGQAHLERVCQ